MSPHLAEIVYAAGAGAKLAAVVRFSDYPPEAARLPRVGDASRIDIERVLAVAPDLVLGWRSGNQPGDLERLERLGLRVLVTEPERLADIPRLVRTIGGVAGSIDEAERAARSLEDALASLRERYASRPKVRVFYEIWHRPILTINRRHLISDVIALCGGENVFDAAALLTPSVSMEAIVAARPQLILGGSSIGGPGALSEEWKNAPVRALRRLPVRYVPPDTIQRQSPRIAQGARTVCEAIDEARRLPS